MHQFENAFILVSVLSLVVNGKKRIEIKTQTLSVPRGLNRTCAYCLKYITACRLEFSSVLVRTGENVIKTVVIIDDTRMDKDKIMLCRYGVTGYSFYDFSR